jgi:hypothetical protein
MVGKPPIKKWRVGNIEMAIWDNEKKVNGTTINFKTSTLSRSYKKKDEDIWRNEVINNIRRQDIQKLMAVLMKAQDYLFFEVRDRDHEDD